MNLVLFAEQDPTGLAGGRYPAPSWVIWLLCAAVVIGATVFLVLRVRRAKAKPRGGR